jgi:hypothetical protein
MVTPVQTVVEVRKLGHHLEPPYDSHYYCFPLPQLLNGEDYVADFRRIGTTHYQFLEGKRVACLSRAAWAALIRRYVFHCSRFDLGQERTHENIGELWHEFELWERWAQERNTPAGYQEWLNERQRNGPYAGTIRRELLAFASDQVVAEL